MKKYLVSLILALTVTFSGCYERHYDKTVSEITIEGTADSARIRANWLPDTVIYKYDYPYIYRIYFDTGSGTAASSADGMVYNISNTGLIFVTEIYDITHSPDTAHYTIEPHHKVYLR